MSNRQTDHSKPEWLGPEADLPARRIVSLVPSLTHSLFDLGAGAAIVGRTEYCTQPRGRVEKVETIGGTKDPDLGRIAEISPDIILASREENGRAAVLKLAEEHAIWLCDPHGPRDARVLWLQLGKIVGRREEGYRLAASVDLAIHEAVESAASRGSSGPRFLCYVWKDPWMAAGHGTYISNLLELGGFRNALPDGLTRYPKLTDADLLSPGVDVHLFTTEPYRFDLPGDLGPLKGASARAILVDGRLLSWYPSHTVAGLQHAARIRERLEKPKP